MASHARADILEICLCLYSDNGFCEEDKCEDMCDYGVEIQNFSVVARTQKYIQSPEYWGGDGMELCYLPIPSSYRQWRKFYDSKFRDRSVGHIPRSGEGYGLADDMHLLIRACLGQWPSASRSGGFASIEQSIAIWCLSTAVIPLERASCQWQAKWSSGGERQRKVMTPLS